jgi:hypothetical protein
VRVDFLFNKVTNRAPHHIVIFGEVEAVAGIKFTFHFEIPGSLLLSEFHEKGFRCQPSRR